MLKNKNGKIINITSVVGHTGNIGQANYAASKSGIIGMSKSLALEYGKKHKNALYFSRVHKSSNDKISENFKKTLEDKISLERFGNSNDVANIVVFVFKSIRLYYRGNNPC